MLLTLATLQVLALNYQADPSTDAGTANFIAVTSSTDGVKQAAISAGEGRIWISSDSSVTWAAVPFQFTRNFFGLAASADGTKLAVIVQDWFNGNIWISSDSGVTWVERSPGGRPRKWTSITSSTDGEFLAVTDTCLEVWTSSDSGETWTQTPEVPLTAYPQFMSASPDGTKLLLGEYGGSMWRSTNSGGSFTVVGARRRLRGLQAAGLQWVATAWNAAGTKVLAVTQNGNIWLSNDAGATYTEDSSVGSPKEWRAITWDMDVPTTAVAAAANSNLWLSHDAGATWAEELADGGMIKDSLAEHHLEERWSGIDGGGVGW